MKIKNKNFQCAKNIRFLSMKKLIMIFALAFMLISCSGGEKGPSSEQISEFATCLTDSGVTMYGAFWCPHCAKTKKKFGSAFKNINYVECDPRGDDSQAELCIEKGIDKYDTWEFADGSRVISEPSFEVLAEKSGCSLPEVV